MTGRALKKDVTINSNCPYPELVGKVAEVVEKDGDDWSVWWENEDSSHGMCRMNKFMLTPVENGIKRAVRRMKRSWGGL